MAFALENLPDFIVHLLANSLFAHFFIVVGTLVAFVRTQFGHSAQLGLVVAGGDDALVELGL